MLKLTLEHILSLAIKDTCPHLQILTFQEFCNSNSCGVWRARLDRLLLLLRLLRLNLLLLSSLLLAPLLRQGLSLQLLDELFNSHSVLLCVNFKLSPHGFDLLLGWLLSWLKSHLYLWALRTLRRFLRSHSYKCVEARWVNWNVDTGDVLKAVGIFLFRCSLAITATVFGVLRQLGLK